MKLAVFASVLGSTMGFHVASPFNPRSRVAPLFESTLEKDTSATLDVSTTLAKSELLETAQSLNDEYGCLLIDSSAQETLREAVEKLEMVSEPRTDTTNLVGDWTLLCSTASASIEGGPLEKIAGIDTSKMPFFNEGPIKEIRNRLNKSLKVQQLVKAGSSDGIDRIDHVLDYMPPDTLSDFMNSLPDAIKNLNINPLQVSESKLILKHKAEVESVIPVIKIKLILESIILNVAGKSQSLDPEGADVLGINVPFGEFLNAGSFETTYMDDDIRISRSKVGIVDQLRVFVRSGSETVIAEDEEDIFLEEDVVEEDVVDEDYSIESPSDVEGDL